MMLGNGHDRASVTYDPSCFDVSTLAEAQAIILTPEAGLTSEVRWRDETPYLVSLIEEHLRPKRGMVLLDYGCGVGRLARPILGKHGCAIVGVDASASMRALSASCVDSVGFVAIAPELMHIFGEPFADVAIAIWTLQHCLYPDHDVRRISLSLKRRGLLFVVNNVKRAVPCRGGQWADDGIDICRVLLDEGFERVEQGKLMHDAIPVELRDVTFWAVYQK